VIVRLATSESAGPAELTMGASNDLLMFPGADRVGRQTFLEDALQRLAEDQHALTRVVDGVLVDCWWIRLGGPDADPTATVVTGPTVIPSAGGARRDAVERLLRSLPPGASSGTVDVVIEGRDADLVRAFLDAGATIVREAQPRRLRDDKGEAFRPAVGETAHHAIVARSSD
jgi:hypothetical protein